jgi:hypothetical protein
MLSEQQIVDYCNKFNYDIRNSGNGRWIDQKCTPDIVSFVADCIYNYAIHNNSIDSFTTGDIWYSQYASENAVAIFKKPGVEKPEAKNEYDKFFQQPMEMLSNAGVLSKEKRGVKNYYNIQNMDLLEYIALREKNALVFLVIYIEKVLEDSEIIFLFTDFFDSPTKQSFSKLKDGYVDFIIEYTKINGRVECSRIFTKVLNPLAFFKDTYGTQRGYISKQIITYDMLMYNRNNFRDLYTNKPKGITRNEYKLKNKIIINEKYYKYQSAKARRFLRKFNDEMRKGHTEHIDDSNLMDAATHIHHIFPESDHPEICFYLENLIALTPTQHLNFAHPNGRTKEINVQYQHLLLLSKADRIEENLTDSNVERIYEFSKFASMLNIGLDVDDFSDIPDMDFPAIINAINVTYALR